MDLFKPRKHPYVEPHVQDAETMEIETKKGGDEFFDLQQKLNVIENAATEQKRKQNDLIDLVDDVLHENNPFNNKIKTEYIYTEENLFDDTDSKDIKIVFGDVTEEKSLVTVLKFHLMIKWPQMNQRKKKNSNPNTIRLLGSTFKK